MPQIILPDISRITMPPILPIYRVTKSSLLQFQSAGNQFVSLLHSNNSTKCFLFKAVRMQCLYINYFAIGLNLNYLVIYTLAAWLFGFVAGIETITAPVRIVSVIGNGELPI